MYQASFFEMYWIGVSLVADEIQGAEPAP